MADTTNNALRRISPTGEVTTIVGGAPSPPGADGDICRDGPADQATLPIPKDVVVDANGVIFVTSAIWIRKITPAP
ncbi:MAG: hypothetical protein FWD68_13110 [Alphaproteobacteria bacterium]|nr:hypothetical protein [Alphaproteobacteria bacterium]